MYGYSLIRTPSLYPGNGSLCFQPPFNQWLNCRYQILKFLGQGGFGQTFLAVDKRQNSLPCVVKQVFLQGDKTHYQTTLDRFYEEVKRLAELGKHPQIPELLDTFEQDGCAFIVQGWIDGWTLEQEAETTPFDEAEIWNVLREVLPILQYLHDRQIIHRDIKPANLIRRKCDRQLVLVDFGAAKQITRFNSLHTGTMIGSVEYAAPEQIKGQAVFASDLYSLGVTCLYLLTQMHPFDLYDIVEDAWKWQAYLPHPISSDLQAILCKLLQPAVRRRYQSAAEVLADLNSSSASTSAIVYLPPTQDWYYLPDKENNSDSERQSALFLSSWLTEALETPQAQEIPLLAEETSKPFNGWVKKLQIRCSNLFNKDTVELVFTLMLIFMLTCIGSMLMICFVFEMEKRENNKQLLPKTTVESSSVLPAPDLSA